LASDGAGTDFFTRCSPSALPVRTLRDKRRGADLAGRPDSADGRADFMDTGRGCDILADKGQEKGMTR